MSEKPEAETFGETMGSVWSTLEKEAEEEEREFQEAVNARAADKDTEKSDDDTQEVDTGEKTTETTDVGGDVPGGTEPDDKEADDVDDDNVAGDKETREEEVINPLAHWGFKENEIEEWNKLPKENREFLISRDKKFQATAERKEQNVAGVVRALEPLREEMVRSGISDADAVRRFVAVHTNMMDPKTRGAAVRDLLTMYGMDPNNITEELPEKDATLERVEGVERKLEDQRAEEINRSRMAMEAEIRGFRESGDAPHWDEVLPEMRYLFSTYADNQQEAPGPKELYARACKLNESVVAKVASQKTTDEAKRAEAAKKAAGVKSKGETTSADRVKKPKSESLLDTLNRSFDEVEETERLATM